MILGKSYFTLQTDFVRRIAASVDLSEAEAFLRYTTFYRYGPGPGGKFDPQHPVWQAFLAACGAGAGPAAWMHDHYVKVHAPPPHSTAHGRCFRYDYAAEWRTVRLHFANNAPDGVALRASEIPHRLMELRDLFAQVAEQHPDTERVRGRSWLYHLPAYRRLFPPAYVATVTTSDGPLSGGSDFQHQSLWGQFLDRHGEVKPDVAGPFLAAVARARSVAEIEAAFPYRVLAAESTTGDFYRHFGIEGVSA